MEEEAPDWQMKNEDEEENIILISDERPSRKVYHGTKVNIRTLIEAAASGAITSAIASVIAGAPWRGALAGAGLVVVKVIVLEIFRATGRGVSNEE